MNEALRVIAVNKFKEQSISLEKELSEIVEMAAEICETPIALVTLIDEDTQWIKVNKGLNIEKTTRSASFCAHAIEQDEIFMVEDSHLDSRFRNNPLVTGETNIRFYAGSPIQTHAGLNLGSLCVIDHKPRTLNDFQTRMLKRLSNQAIRLMELKSSLFEINRQNELLKDIAFLQAHQLRGPLSAIIGTLNLIKEEEYKAPKEYYVMLEDSVNEFDKVIQQIVKMT
jgi:GAF domain-containing protein